MKLNKLEKELKARLQMIPHQADRRKFRGIIQRIRTAEKQQSRLLGMREMAAALIGEDEKEDYTGTATSFGEMVDNVKKFSDVLERNNLRQQQRKIRDQLLSKGEV